MKKRTLLALFCAAMMLPAAAQWNPGDDSMTLIDKTGNLEYYEPTMIRKADGTTILGYVSYGLHENPQTSEPDTANFFYLHLQKLDANGNKQWGDQGVIVSSKPTDLASYGHLNMDTLSNGNIILTHEDIREVEEVGGHLTHTNIKDSKTVAYCYNQQGQSVWSPDGVMLPYYVVDTTALTTTYTGEKMAISGDKIYLAAAILQQFTRPDPHTLTPVDSYVHYFEVACYDYNGNKLGERLDSVNNAFTYSLAPAPDGDVYIIYVNDNDGYSAQRIGSDCQFKWANAPVVETSSVVSREQTGAFAIPPYEMIPISDGSVGMIYKAFKGNSWSILYYNRLYPNGDLLDDHVIISDTTGVHHSFAMRLDDDILTIFENYAHNRTELGEYYLYLNQIKLDGTHLLPNIYGYWLDETTAIDPEVLCIVKADENYNVIVSSEDCATRTYPAYCYTISPDGKLFQRKPVIGDVYMSNFDCIVENNYAYFAITKSEYGKGGLWISCIDGTDYTNSVELTGALPGKFTVDATGKQVNFSKGNLMYLPYRQTYNFAATQYETRNAFNQWITETSMDWMDLYGWGTGDHASKVSTNDADYAAFNEWGVNAILNSTFEPGTWRAMTKDEWDYLLHGRTNADTKHAIGQVDFNGYAPVNGLIILPDTFEMPQGLQIDVNAHEFDVNVYMVNAWQRMEAAGAVFIPASGYRTGTDVFDVDHLYARGANCYYWTTTEAENNYAQSMIINIEGPSFIAQPRSKGFSVRLVKDAEGSQGIEDIKVKETGKAVKVLRDGQLYIIRDGKVFNATGVQVR